MLVSDFNTRVGTLLHDDTNVRWQPAELINWINDGQREVSSLFPECYSVNGDVTLVAGTKQSLPVGGIRLMDVVRNRGNTTTPADGNAITATSRTILDRNNRAWHSMAKVSIVQHYCFDNRDPKRFYVYPPVVANVLVEAVYQTAPVNVAATTDTIALDDTYVNLLLNFVLDRAKMKDAEYASRPEEAREHYKRFQEGIMLRAKINQMSSPNEASPPFNDMLPGPRVQQNG